MEKHEWRLEFSWVNAHAWHRRNDKTDHLAKEEAYNKYIEEYNSKIPKSAVLCELKEKSVQQWQNEWEMSSISFLPKEEDRLKLRLNVTPTITARLTGHCKIKTYL